jgi:uncharacterized protein YjbJ (UPF0337 family)
LNAQHRKGNSEAFRTVPSGISFVDEGSKMNTDQMKGNWKQFVGKAKEKWGKLTDNDWQIVERKRDHLVGRIQECYGIAREEAERQVADFERSHERLLRTPSDRQHPLVPKPLA